MKKFILHSILFIPVAFLGYWLLLIAWGEMMDERNHQKLGEKVHGNLHMLVSKRPNTNLSYPIADYGHTFSRFQDAKNTRPKKVLFLGSSFAYRQFDMRFFRESRIPSFNLGSSAQTPLQTELLLKRYLHKIKPKLVILEVSPIILENNGLESSMDIIANDTIDFETVKMALRVHHLKSYNTLLYGYYRQSFHRNDSITEHRWRRQDIYHRDGYVETKKKGFKKTYIRDRYIHQDPKQVEAFDRLLGYLKKNKVPYYLVMAPKTEALYSTYMNIDNHIELMKSRGRFINFQNTIELEDSIHFYDYYHLNQKGVTLFNQKLMDTLALKQLK